MAFNPRTWYQDQSVAAHYDRDRFHSLAGKLFNYCEQRAISRALQVVPVGSYVLDLPCGTGRITELLLKKGYRTLGVDISPSMMQVAARRLQGFGDQVQFRVGDAGALEVPDNTFECVTCIRFLSHFDAAERTRFLQTFSRVSKRWVIIGISYTNIWYRFRRFMKHLIGSPKPIRFPVSKHDLQRELAASDLKIFRRFFPLSLLSEDLILLLYKQ